MKYKALFVAALIGSILFSMRRPATAQEIRSKDDRFLWREADSHFRERLFG